MNTQINITENGTTTLATAGKYCDRNIDVNVNVEDSGADAFWDGFQNHGERESYEYAFAQSGFEQLRPKYKVVPTNSRSIGMFQDISGPKIIEKAYFDLSNCNVSQTSTTNGHYVTFRSASESFPCTLEVVEDVGMQPAYYYQTFRGQTLLHTIEVLRVIEETMFSAAFTSCRNLQNITIEGMIGQNGFDVKDSTKLSRASIESIINALSSTTSGFLDITSILAGK